MIYSQTGGFQGLAFAVPINVAMHVKDQLLKTGHVQRGRLGITIQPVSQSLAKSFGLSDPQGALVNSVVKGGPAAKAGLQPGDVILQVNNQTIQDAHDLPALIAGMQPGTRVQLKVWRDRTAKNVEATLDKLSATDSGTDVPDSTQNKLGLILRTPTPKEKEDYSLTRGLVVQSVAGAALSAGIQPGDIVLAIDGQPVSTAQQVKNRVARAMREHSNVVALLVQRGDIQIFVPIDIS
jgi:serine protease Do